MHVVMRSGALQVNKLSTPQDVMSVQVRRHPREASVLVQMWMDGSKA